MGNAAQRTTAGKQVRYLSHDGWRTVDCGNFLYERVDGPGGPFLLTFLEQPDRKSRDNEPIGTASGVLEWWISRDRPEVENVAPAAPPPVIQ